jgi:hypothetical protein
MLRITIPEAEYFDERTQTFITTKEQTLMLEHSLVSISKWESKWEKPFLSKDKKTTRETVDYIRCMTLTQNVDPNVYLAVNDDIVEQVSRYIDAPMTATWFNEDNNKRGGSGEVVTSEVIYYWMIALNIPPEYQKWHLNRLLTLIRVCNAKNNPKKMSKKDIFAQNRALNAARKKQSQKKG